MDLIVETKRGWTEAIIDDDCEFAKFYKIADVLTENFKLLVTNELSDFDTIYKDFEYNGSKLVLHYNIYLGVSIYPQELKKATTKENESVLEIGNLLFQKLIDLDWRKFDGGNTVGQKGSELGEILIDLENINGARVTLEKDCRIAPFAITLGIYGLLLHTHFESTIKKANEYVTHSKFRINKIIDMYNVEAERQNDNWHNKLNKLVNELAEITFPDDGK